jgi:hypothetical protein
MRYALSGSFVLTQGSQLRSHFVTPNRALDSNSMSMTEALERAVDEWVHLPSVSR